MPLGGWQERNEVREVGSLSKWVLSAVLLVLPLVAFTIPDLLFGDIGATHYAGAQEITVPRKQPQQQYTGAATPDRDPHLTLNQGIEQEVGPSGDINQPFTVTNSGNFADQYVNPTLSANTGSNLSAVDIGGVLQYTE
jgi:hypothetical protein